MNETEGFDRETFVKFLQPLYVYVGEIYESITSNIRKVQEKQKKVFDQRNLSNNEVKTGAFILLRNDKGKARNGGKFSFAWLSSYIVSEITPKGVRTLKKRHGKILKVKYNLSKLKLYVLREDCWYWRRNHRISHGSRQWQEVYIS